jgi:enoyl-CoA hydratase
MTAEPVLYDVADRIATITLNRPEARNALSSEVLVRVPELMRTADLDDAVDVIVLTGTDPAFCAGLDLKELGSSAGNLGGGSGADGSRSRDGTRGPFPHLTKPLIGAINGVAVTGGFEYALNCDFLVASERAKFGDTHARVGVMPGWGLTVLLPQAIGVRRAREMSFTGNFMGADEALQWGLAGNEQDGVRQIRETYASIAHDDDAWEAEARDSRAWQRAQFHPDKVAARRAAIQERGRTQ